MSSGHQIHTYHCLCSTLLLATPYSLSSLPRRADPSLDRALILPLPPLSRPAQEIELPAAEQSQITAVDFETHVYPTDDGEEAKVLPSLIMQNMRPTRKEVIVRREDGFEKRRVYRCGRCGVGVGYVLVGQEEDPKEREKVLYLLHGGLVETGEMGLEGGRE